jgi:hypothetical protein
VHQPGGLRCSAAGARFLFDGFLQTPRALAQDAPVDIQHRTALLVLTRVALTAQ